MTQIAVRLEPTEVEWLDRLVAAGTYPSRAAAVRAALAVLHHEEEDRQIARAYREAFERVPVTNEEREWGEVGLAALGRLDGDEQPDRPVEPAARGTEDAAGGMAVQGREVGEIEDAARRILDLVQRGRRTS